MLRRRILQFEMFLEVSLKEDMTEYNLAKGTPAIIVGYCPRPPGQEDGYVNGVIRQEWLQNLTSPTLELGMGSFKIIEEEF